MNQIEAFLKLRIGLTNEELLQKVMDAFYIRNLKKGDYLIECGKHPAELCFLMKGLLRGFFTDQQGNEITDSFIVSVGCTAMPYADFTKPSPINIMALEDSQVMVIPIQLVRELLAEHIEIAHIYNKLLLLGAAEHWEIKTALYQHTAEQRYEWFLKRYDGLINRVPHIHIASFLGITPVTLSRLRRKRKEKKLKDENHLSAPDYGDS